MKKGVFVLLLAIILVMGLTVQAADEIKEAGQEKLDTMKNQQEELKKQREENIEELKETGQEKLEEVEKQREELKKQREENIEELKETGQEKLEEIKETQSITFPNGASANWDVKKSDSSSTTNIELTNAQGDSGYVEFTVNPESGDFTYTLTDPEGAQTSGGGNVFDVKEQIEERVEEREPQHNREESLIDQL